MKRLIIAGPWWILVAIVVGACCALTECRYENVTAWEGNCSPNQVSTDTQGQIYLSLSCPGFQYSRWPFSTSGPMVSKMAEHTLPQSFWCKVTRSGDSTCILPEQSEKR